MEIKKVIKNLAGKRFGKIVVLDEYESRASGTYWKCVCDCGNVKYIRSAHLTDGKIKSCGCGRGDGSRTHGESTEKLYHVWQDMKLRCYTSSAKEYNEYGKRGISMCQEWKNSYLAFKQWAENNGYCDGLSIDRIDNDGNYEPSNCRWATRKQQQNNRRNNVYITIGGETKTLKEWCETFNKNYSTVWRRYRKLHWSIERALQ